MKASLKRLAKERNEMLKKCDVNELRKFINAHPEHYGEMFRNAINNASDEVLEITLHKMYRKCQSRCEKIAHFGWLLTVTI